MSRMWKRLSKPQGSDGKYKDQLAFIFRNFPLSSLHPNARAAAATAEAAGLQGKYWEMHNFLYENQSQWNTLSADTRVDTFTDYAKSLGVNVDTFKTDFASSKVNQKINYDIAIGKKAKVNATPTIFLNGKSVGQDDWNDEKNLDTLVSNTLKENNIALPAAQ